MRATKLDQWELHSGATINPGLASVDFQHTQLRTRVSERPDLGEAPP